MPNLLQKIKHLCLTNTYKKQVQVTFAHTNYESVDEFYNNQPAPIESLKGHTDETYDHALDRLTEELLKIGTVTEGDEAWADFIMSRYDANSNPIGIIADYTSAASILAIATAQQKFQVPYSVKLEGESAEIVILPDHKLITLAEDKEAKTELTKYGLELHE